MKIFCKLSLALLLLCGAGCETALQNASLDHARSDIKWHFYRFALEDLSRAEDFDSDAPPAKMAEIAYLKGVCLAGMNKAEDAKAMFHFVADKYPDTEYAYLAKEKLEH